MLAASYRSRDRKGAVSLVRSLTVAARGVVLLAIMAVSTAGANPPVFISESLRVGPVPAYEGSGWIGEAFLDIPDESSLNLITAEGYAQGRTPDFTFRTEWIDFPAGPMAVDLDATFATMGDFLDDHIHDVSDPSKLDAPFGHFLLRFSGLLRVSMADDVSSAEDPEGGPGLPVWVGLGTDGYDGYETFMGDFIYRRLNIDPEHGFFSRIAIVHAAGLFPITITYFNRDDPNGESDPPMERAGIELYSWHGGGLAWPAGDNMVHFVRGPATLVPPRVIYQIEDVLPLAKGDFNADSKVDVLDFQWFQACFTGSVEGGTVLPLGCHAHDFDDDADVDTDDLAEFHAVLTANDDK